MSEIQKLKEKAKIQYKAYQIARREMRENMCKEYPLVLGDYLYPEYVEQWNQFVKTMDKLRELDCDCPEKSDVW